MNIDQVRTLLAPKGHLRAAINLGNPVLAQRSPGGEPTGISVALASAIAARLQVPLTHDCFGHAKESYEAITRSDVDIAFLAVDPERAQQVAFSSPYVQIEGTYLVRSDGEISRSAELDRAATRIASSKGSAYGLHLARALKHASLVEIAEVEDAAEKLAAGEVDAVAGIRQSLNGIADRAPQFKVLADPFMAIRQAVCVAKQNEIAIAFIEEVIVETASSGVLRASLDASGQRATILAGQT